MRISDWSSDVCSSDLFDDPVIEIAITPNRGDCLGVRGVARDLAAAGLGTLKPLQAEPVRGHFESPIAWRRDLPADRQHACPYVAGRSFRGVRNGPSPAWMQDRLRAIRLRPLSALVRAEEHTSELQSLISRSYAVFCLKK